MKLKEHLQISKKAVKQSFLLDKRFTVCLFLEAFLAAITGYIPVYFSAKVVDALYARASLKTIAAYVILTVGLVFLVKVIHTYVASAKNIAISTWYRNEDWMYSEKAMQMAYESMEDPEVTRLMYRVRKESQTGFNRWFLQQSMEHFTTGLTKIAASLAMVASFFALPSISVFVKLAMVAGLGLTLYVSIISTAKAFQLQEDFFTSQVDINVISEQFVEYIGDYSAGKDIRLYGMKDYLADAYFKLNASYFDKAARVSYKQALWKIPGTVLEHVFKFGIYMVLIYAALEGEITVGSIAKYVACIMLLIGAVTDLVTTTKISATNHHYLKRYFSYFDIPNNMYKGSLTVEKRDDNEYSVEFRDVSFRYPNTDTYALRHVNLKFKIGEKLAVVGANGSGKTTFIKLLCRLYDPTEGEILLNGVNIQKYDYDEYMSIFSVVFQDFNLFSFKLGEVVASSKSFDRDKVKNCLVKANFGDRFNELPDGADTYLYKGFDKSGVEISGGEAQKIALARALYKDAPFIILDEPTAALDPVSEYEVYSNFNEIAGDKTAVYISHRLASCRFCDKIAVFDNGEIVQTGDHRSLLDEKNGKYHELWHAQAQYYTRKEAD